VEQQSFVICISHISKPVMDEWASMHMQVYVKVTQNILAWLAERSYSYNRTSI